MPPAFKTKKGAPSVEIPGIGVCDEDGQGGVLLERAAPRMAELQNEDGKPLTGKTLEAAAKDWAESADLTVGSATEDTPTPEPADPPAGQES